MLKKPVFKPHLVPLVLPEEGVLLLSEDSRRVLQGSIYELLTPLLDGQCSTDDMVDTLAGQVSGAQVYYALMQLEKNGHICEATDNIPPAVAAFWEGLGVSATTAIHTLQQKQVKLTAIGDADMEPLRTALAALDINLTESAADLTLVVTDDYQSGQLDDINATQFAFGKAWMPVRLTGHESWIGPLYHNQETGCHACLVSRLRRHTLVHEFAAQKLGMDKLPFTALASLGTSQRIAAEMTALEVLKYLAGAANRIEGQLLSFDSYDSRTENHVLLKDAYCPVCGHSPVAEAQPVILKNRKVTFAQDGGHRTTSPEQTLKKYQHLVSPVTGVVSALTPAQDAQGIAYVYMAGHNLALKLEHLDHLKTGLRNASAGKGVSETQAKASALCEAIERYSGECQGEEVIESASLNDMRARYGDDVIHPNAVMRYSERQLAEHEAWNARKSKFNRVPEPLDEEAVINWTPVWSLSQQKHKYLPTQLIYYREDAGPDCKKFYALGCSNGNASGNNLEEAVLQGFFELVERDAVALWWYNRLRRPGVDVNSFGEPYLVDLADYYDSLGRDVWALDITSDLGIPTFVAVSRLRDTEQDCLLFGLGCHFDARIAVQRAFAEMNQMMGIAQQLDPEAEGPPLEDKEVVSWLTKATVENQLYMLPAEDTPPSRLEDFPQQHSGDLLTDINRCRQIIESRGMEMLVLDQTRKDVGMPVVKVVVPGLRHFWARYAPGRLYDVPVAMGWLARPLSEDELNPIPVFL